MSKFSEDIHRFSISVDIVTDSTYSEITEMIGDYFCKQLNFDFVEILKAEYDRARKCEILQTFWTKNSNEGMLTNSILDENGKYTTQTASVFDRRKDVWLVSKDKGLLSHGDNYIDLWSSLDSFPVYESANEFNIKTSVILPIHRKNRVWGVLNIESESYLDSAVYRMLKSEIKSIADSFSILTNLHETSSTQNENTEQMVRKLSDAVVAEKPRKFTKPTLFVASSAKADKNVISSIRKVLDKDTIRLAVDSVFWQDMDDIGDIRKQIIKEIDNATYGICYFSEPENEGEIYRYRDNPNVLFEAGLLHAKREFLSMTPDNWIPIREKESPNIPFDVAGERIIHIDRLSNNKINREEFEEQLERKIVSMLNI